MADSRDGLEIVWEHVPIHVAPRPLFPDHPVLASPFYLQRIDHWRWETVVVTHTLQYLREGHIRYVIDGRSYEVLKGGSFLFRPGQKVRGWDAGGKPVTMFGAHFKRLPRGDLPRGTAHTCIRETDLFESLTDHAIAWRQKRGALPQRQCESAIRMLYALFLGNLKMPPEDPEEKAVHDLLESIRARPADDWRVEVMCGRTRISRSRLTRWFHQLTGMTPNRYVIRVRIAKATQFLAMTDKSIPQIADELGYRDIYFFSRQFRQVAGHPPARYRRHGGPGTGG
jgi:AraC family transcriptional regulator, arabinose operon regulatory protein